MNNRSKYLAKNIGILTISNFSSKILVFLLVPLYTSVLSTEDVGFYDLVVSSLSLLFPLLSLNIVDAVMRFLMDKEKSRHEVVLIGIRYVSISMIPLLVFLMAVSKFSVFNSIHGFEIYIFIYYLFYCFYQFFIQFAKGIELVSAMSVAGVLGTIITLSANILLLVIYDCGLYGFFIANILGQALPTFYLLIRTKIWVYIKGVAVNKELQKEMLVYCTPLIATAVGWWVNSTSDKYIVSLICGVAANGILSVSYKIPSIINTLQSIFIQAWQISAVKEYGEDNTSAFYGNTFSVLNILMSAACSFLIFLSKPLGRILYQKEFYEAWKYVPFLLIASVLNCSSGFLGPILSAKKASKPMAISAIYGAVVNIIANVGLVFIIGIQGATIATVISSFIIYQVRRIAVGKEIVINNYTSILVTWILLLIQAVMEIYTPFWWAELIIMFLLLFINRKELLKIINTIVPRNKPY